MAAKGPESVTIKKNRCTTGFSNFLLSRGKLTNSKSCSIGHHSIRNCTSALKVATKKTEEITIPFCSVSSKLVRGMRVAPKGFPICAATSEKA